MDGVNARHLEGLPDPIDLIVGDLSFISLELILPTVHRLLRPGGRAVLLVKPQFEAGRSAIGKGGRVEGSAREQAIAKVKDSARAMQFDVLGGVDCGIAGAKSGNVEHFLYLQRSEPAEDRPNGPSSC
jgi:23S rRNA (cytidine1920-2'-O)/16S rRNA (cytidine1409-2'-O)-methyltransferase